MQQTDLIIGFQALAVLLAYFNFCKQLRQDYKSRQVTSNRPWSFSRAISRPVNSPKTIPWRLL